METNKKSPKNPQNVYVCDCCDYNTSNKKDYTKHLTTSKHKRLIETNKNPQKIPTSYFHICECDKKYKHLSSLYKHKKICKTKTVEIQNNANIEIIDKDLIMMIIKQNTDLQNVIYEQVKETNEFKNMVLDVCQKNVLINNITNNTTNNTNSNNKTFNLNFFLNETCKDAMNIMEFVDSINLQLSDFERVGEVGFVNGISDIIIKNLKQLDITERPIHCTDKKRAIMYVKDDDKWEKEDDTNKKVRRAIKYIANKNIKLMDAYKALHPDCQKSHSKYSDSYNKFVIEALGGSGNEDCDNEDKIISRLSKVVTIEK